MTWSGARSSIPRSRSWRPSGRGLLLLAGARCRPVQVRRTDLAAAQQLEALGEDVLQLADRAALQQHVPVRAHRLLDLHLRLDAVGAQALGAAARALPRRGHL